MPPIAEWCRRVWYRLNQRRFDEALKREMEAHRESMREPARFGNVLRLREEAGDVWGWGWLDRLARDVRLAVRVLARSRGFTSVSVVSLALGLALVAVTVSIVNAYLLRPLPYAEADRLYHVMYAPPGPWEPRGMETLDWRVVSDVVEFPITASGDTFYLGDGDHAQAARGARVALSFVEGLGVRAVAGRVLNAADFAAEADPVAMLGYALWRDRYGFDPGVVGRLVRTETESRSAVAETFRVVGVLPPDFYFGRDSRQTVDLLTPLAATARTYMVRLYAGVPQAVAERRLTEAARQVASDLPADWTGVRLEPVRERYVAELRPVLTGVTIAAAIVLVIVCANVAVLALLRALRRHKEMAVREALGSGRGHLIRVLSIEAVLLCGTALALGLLLAQVATHLVAPLIEVQLGRPAPGGTGTLAVDWTVLWIVGALGVAVALALSWLPLLARTRGRLTDVIGGDRASATDSRSTRRLRSALIAFEVAGTLVLLVAGGLMVRSVIGMVRTDLGFEPEGLVRARIVLRGADYPDGPAFFRFYDRFAERLTAVTGAPLAFANWPPFNDLPAVSVETDALSGDGVPAGAIGVGASYFATMCTPLRSGRDFTATDVQTGAPVAVVGESLAARLWPDGQAVGRQVRVLQQTPSGVRPGPWRTIVGVAADVRHLYSDVDVGEIYEPLSAASSFGRYGSFYIRTDRAPSTLLTEMRSIASAIDPRAAVDSTGLVAEENRQLAGAAFLARLLTVFAVVASFIAAIGIYGVTAYAVQQREREIAIRMAVGAAAGAIVRMFLAEGGRVLAVGVALGLAGVVLLARVTDSRLYGVPALDVPIIVMAALMLMAVGLAAAWRPAKRASTRSPMVVLKEG